MTPQEIESPGEMIALAYTRIPEHLNNQVVYLMQQYAPQQSAALESENKELRKVLKELVELKDMKDRNMFGLGMNKEKQSEYLSREALAWESARKLSHERN